MDRHVDVAKTVLRIARVKINSHRSALLLLEQLIMICWLLLIFPVCYWTWRS